MYWYDTYTVYTRTVCVIVYSILILNTFTQLMYM